MKTEVIGLGKAGLPLAAVIAEAGFDVIGLDVSQERVNQINSGVNPFPEEPGLSELIKKHGGKKITATTDPLMAAKNSQVHIILVPLLLDKNNEPDFKYFNSALEPLSKELKKGDIIVVETTLPLGVLENYVKPKIEAHGFKTGKDFYLAYSPERLMSGFALSRFSDFPKVIGGVDPESGKKAYEFYKKIIPQIQLVSNSRTAEAIKIAEGVYRDVNIALANELLKLFEQNEISYPEVRKYANHKFCNLHEAGLGVGGHCIPVYPWFFIKNAEHKDRPELAELMLFSRRLNDDMIIYWGKKIISDIKKLGKENPSVCIKGITYRPKVNELYHTRSIPLYLFLKNNGVKVFAWDEMIGKEELEKLGMEYRKPQDCDYIFEAHSAGK